MQRWSKTKNYANPEKWANFDSSKSILVNNIFFGKVHKLSPIEPMLLFLCNGGSTYEIRLKSAMLPKKYSLFDPECVWFRFPFISGGVDLEAKIGRALREVNDQIKRKAQEWKHQSLKHDFFLFWRSYLFLITSSVAMKLGSLFWTPIAHYTEQVDMSSMSQNFLWFKSFQRRCCMFM